MLYSSPLVFKELDDYLKVHDEHSPDLAYLGCLDYSNEVDFMNYFKIELEFGFDII
jgi:hypothetical protein